MPEETTIQHPDAVQVLWHPSKRVYLKPFLGRSAGLAQAAKDLGVSKPAMSYWVKRLLALGLIRVRGRERQGRTTVTLYRGVADLLRVRLSDLPISCYEAVFEEVAARWRPAASRALTHSLSRQAPQLDLSVFVSDSAGLGIALLPRGPQTLTDDYLYYWGRLWITPAERTQLHQELDALWDRYAALSDRRHKTQAVLLHVMAVPEP